MRRFVLFVPGMNTSNQDGTPTGFEFLQKLLVEQQGYAPRDMGVFSYTGSDMNAQGQLAPRPYGACDANRPINESGPLLAATVRTVTRTYPGTHLALVGHSLCGFLSYALPTWATDSAVDRVITLDAPLHGISGSGSALLDLLHPRCNAAANDLVASSTDPATSAQLAQMYSQWHAGGTQVATVSNANDCLYNLPLWQQSGEDMRWTMTAPADWQPVYQEPIADPEMTHVAVLSDSMTMTQVARFVGPQAR